MELAFIQLISVLMLIISVYTMFSVISHVHRSKKHDEELIALLKNIQENSPQGINDSIYNKKP
ncbi:hypothetical protein [Paenibacillus chibensis]|uniref:hypothetical protein n=1 Tax=Paenibacillus chibensis TaxID=59846 RepID=UPI000FD9A040|nr:hypothetical protein [Paenibacillus chibensis]MEC0368375.1 hypothetical protein [Paenibacillus chibensis]